MTSNVIRSLPHRPRVAVALGSGGARGYAHIGVLEVLQERGHDVVSIAGSSMGALVGGLYAAGGMSDYADWVRTLTYRDVLRMYDLSPRAPGAIRAERIFARVEEIIGDIRIEDLPLDFTAVATDLRSGEERWFQEGRVDVAIRASVALPGFVTPVVIGGRLLADGGLLAPLPIAPTAAARADLTVAVEVSGPNPPWSGVTAPAGRRGRAKGRDALRTVAQALDRDTLRSLTARIAGRRDLTAGSIEREPTLDGIPDEVTEPVLEALPPGLRLLDVMELSFEAVRAGVVRHALAAHPPDILITVPRSACRTLDFHRAAEMIALGRRLAVEALDREHEPGTGPDAIVRSG